MPVSTFDVNALRNIAHNSLSDVQELQLAILRAARECLPQPGHENEPWPQYRAERFIHRTVNIAQELRSTIESHSILPPEIGPLILKACVGLPAVKYERIGPWSGTICQSAAMLSLLLARAVVDTYADQCRPTPNEPLSDFLRRCRYVTVEVLGVKTEFVASLRTRVDIECDRAAALIVEPNAAPIINQSARSAPKPTELADTESNIVAAIGNETLTGEAVAKKLQYPYNSNFKGTLSSLRKRGVLLNMSPGYRVNPSFKQSGHSQD